MSYVTCTGGDDSPESTLKPHDRFKCRDFHVRIAKIVSNIYTSKKYGLHNVISFVLFILCYLRKSCIKNAAKVQERMN
jgi:hypothetical protein